MSLKRLNTRRRVEASENLGFQNVWEMPLRSSRGGFGVALGRWHHSTMKTLRVLGLYFLVLASVLFVWSAWQVKNGLEHADFSFVVLVPVALGLICCKRWAIWSAFVLGSPAHFWL
jgi:hypothetical protein